MVWRCSVSQAPFQAGAMQENATSFVDSGNYHIEVLGKDTAVEVYVIESLDCPLKTQEIMVIDSNTPPFPWS
jgi:hypothetical protein